MKYLSFAIAAPFLIAAFVLIWIGVILGVVGMAVGESGND